MLGTNPRKKMTQEAFAEKKRGRRWATGFPPFWKRRGWEEFRALGVGDRRVQKRKKN